MTSGSVQAWTMPSVPSGVRGGNDPVSVLTINQATAATFSDLVISLTFLCFVRSGSKRIVCPVGGEMTRHEGDLLVFPPHSMVTLENRPLLKAAYCADGVYFAHDLIEAVFADGRHHAGPAGIQILRASITAVSTR